MLKDTINQFMIACMKNKQQKELLATRLILAKIKDTEINNRVKNLPVTNDDIITILKQMIKQRLDSIEQYTKAARIDLVEQENFEITIINKFLPPQLSKEETTTIVNQSIEHLNVSNKQDIGKVVGYIKQNYGNTVDMGFVSTLVKNKLV